MERWYVKYPEVYFIKRNKDPNISTGESRSLLDIALELHGGVTGFNDLSKENQEKYSEVLQYALETWQDSPIKSSKNFDDAVKILLKAAVIDYLEKNDEMPPRRQLPVA